MERTRRKPIVADGSPTMQQYDETTKKETLLRFREGLATCGPSFASIKTFWTTEWDSSIPAASSTRAEDLWQKLGASPGAALISSALLSKPWTVACEGKHSSRHSRVKPAARQI